MGRTNNKPTPWAWTPGQIADDYYRLAATATKIWPVWPNDNAWLRDIVTVERTTPVGAVLGIGGAGHYWDYQGNTYHHTGVADLFPQQWSFFLYWSPEEDPAHSGSVAWAWGSIAERGGNDPTLAGSGEWTGVPNAHYFLRDLAGNTTGQQTLPYLPDPVGSPPTADSFHTLLIAMDQVGTARVYSDGTLLRTHAGLTGAFDFTGYELLFGTVNNRGTPLPANSSHRPRLAMAALWLGTTLTAADAQKLDRAPYGIITPILWTPALIEAPTTLKGEAILQGVGTVTADGQTSATGAADLTGTGILTADGTIGIPTGQAALTGTGILTADGTAIVPIVGEADLFGVGILTAQSLPPLSILTIRQLLAEGIRQSLHLAGRDDVAVYEYPPETVVVPSVVIMPDEPYWVPSNFGRSPLERIRVNLELQMLTPRLEVSESFNDLERLGGIVLQGTLRVPVVQWTELGQPEGVTVNDIETIMTRASVMAHV